MPTATTALRPGISIVGVGRLGTALAIALHQVGYPIDTLVTRNFRETKKTAHLLDVPARVLAAKDLAVLAPTGAVLIATPDDQIEEVAAQLALLPAGSRRKRIVFHTSGALSSRVLSPLAKKAWSTGSIHPLIAVSEAEAGSKALRRAFWCIEGDQTALKLARAIVRDLEGTSFSLTADDKPLYHAAAVMASGNVVALFDVALEMLGRCGLTRTESRRILLPLLESTVRNLSASDPAEALTGTFARGDLATVKRHLKALSNKRSKTALELYRLLGSRSLDLARTAGLDARVVKQLKKAVDFRSETTSRRALTTKR